MDADGVKHLEAVEMHGRIYILPEGAAKMRPAPPATGLWLFHHADIVIGDHGRILKNRTGNVCGLTCQKSGIQ